MPKDTALAKKAELEAKKQLEAARAKEAEAQAEWSDGAKKANAKKLAEEEKRRAKAERKAEAEDLLEQEVAEITKPKKGTGNKSKAGKYANIKLTQAQIQDNLTAEKTAAEKAAEKEKAGHVNDYLGRLEDNANHVDAVDARSIEEALAALDTGNGPKVDKVKLKAAFEAYSESQMPLVKEAKPGLKLSQYKEMIWKSWQKSPENPLVAARR